MTVSESDVVIRQVTPDITIFSWYDTVTRIVVILMQLALQPLHSFLWPLLKAVARRRSGCPMVAFG
ncbi:hypothetical protein AcW1_001862 [Taiwanofungus camphoratus]|nr:hypothetical protein AcW1_001862 [Antrodia cinnamomea]